MVLGPKPGMAAGSSSVRPRLAPALYGVRTRAVDIDAYAADHALYREREPTRALNHAHPPGQAA